MSGTIAAFVPTMFVDSSGWGEDRTRVGVRAHVTITVEIPCPQPWSPDTYTASVYNQAKEDALRALRSGLIIDGLTVNAGTKTHARVVGEPKVRAVIADLDERDGKGR